MSANDPMLEVFIFEAQQLLETLEDVLLDAERQNSLNEEQINEIFRIMHTIKGSASMMSFDSIAKVAHAAEDLFSQIREKKSRTGDWGNLFEIVLGTADIIKADITRIQSGLEPIGNSEDIVKKIHEYLDLITKRGAASPQSTGRNTGDEFDFLERTDMEYSEAPFYKIRITFEPGCQMENMRAFGAVNTISAHCGKIAYIPEELMNDDVSGEIVANGFVMYIQSEENPDDLKKVINEIMFVQSASLILIPDDSDEIPEKIKPKRAEEIADDPAIAKSVSEAIAKQNFISINVNKLDKLVDLVGELVTTESMVTKNPDILKLQLEGFERASQQLRKLINELQDVVMSMRMLPVSNSFHKMQRIVRDMSKKVNKEVELFIIGEETEVDKNIIDTLSDPLMHLIRNSVDHGLESTDERIKAGKSGIGKVTLEARNTGGDVMIIVSDDGRGLDRTRIIRKAIEKGLTTKTEPEISDKEAYNFIFMPGFSTKDEVTEFSGRGVGMDVVRRNIEKIGGTISVESEKGKGTVTQIRIPLTLAIIEGMKLRVGNLVFIVPMLSIQESFKPNMKDVFLDPDGNEQIMIRGECYPIVRLHQIFNIHPEFEDLSEGIIIMIRTDNDSYCLFVDELIGEQQAVIKPLPVYIQKHNNNLHGIGGCAILGDGSISLIIEINNLVTT